MTMRVTRSRLFAVQLGFVKDEIDHDELDRRAKGLKIAMRRLVQAAALRGDIKLVHAAIDSKRVVYVDAAGALAHPVSLWTGLDGTDVSADDAARKVIENARRELRSFIAAKQHLTLARVSRAADRYGSTPANEPASDPDKPCRVTDPSGVARSPVVQVIELQPGGRIEGEGRDGEFSLVADSTAYYLKKQEPMLIVGRVVSLGASKATFRIDKRRHPTMSVSSHAEVPLVVDEAHRDEGQLLRLYRDHVLSGQQFAVLAHVRHDTRSGRVIELVTAGPLFGEGDR